MTPEDIETYVDAAARAIGLPVSPAHRPGVIAYFALAAGMADLVCGLELGHADDSAEVFVPVEPHR